MLNFVRNYSNLRIYAGGNDKILLKFNTVFRVLSRLLQIPVPALFCKFVVMKSTFTKIGSYTYTSEAVIIRGRLEAEGIEVHMADNFTVDNDPLISNAIGGVKLYVKTEQAEQAKQVLSQISRYSLDNEGKLLKCPKCGHHEVEVGTTIKNVKSLLAFLFGFFAVILPFYTKYKYRCNYCGHEFNIQ